MMLFSTPTPVPTPVPIVVASAAVDPWSVILPAVLSGAVIAAVITFGGNYYFAIRKTREETRERLRAMFAEAFATYAAYREYPYVIRRRSADHPADERIRISELIRATQERISYYQAATAAESDAVGMAYKNLIDRTRKVAGTAMKDAWQAPTITEDREVVIPRSVINLEELDGDATAYQKAVRDFLRAGKFGKQAN